MRFGGKMRIQSKREPVSGGKNRIVLRIAVFLLLAALLFAYFNQVLTISASDSNRKIINAFYHEEENTIDVLYLGTSASNRYFISPLAYEETGMTVFTLATMGMPLFFVPELIEEVQKTQEPQLYVIELRSVLKDKEAITDAHIRRVTDSMKFSENRTDAIRKALDFTEGAQESDVGENFLEYYLPIIKYHDRFLQGDVSASEWILQTGENETKGYVTSKSTLTQRPQQEAVYTDERGPLADEAAETLEEVLDYCDSLEQDVLFVLSPFSLKEEQAKQFNTVIDTVESRGYTVLNFNTEEMIETLGIDWDTDFYNSKHVNYLGAQKYTAYLTAYLAAHYDLEDHRGDSAYQSWEDALDYYRDYVADGIQFVKE